MNNSKHCPIPVSGGGDCWNEPHPASQYWMCVEHWRKIAASWHENEPAVIVRCPRCKTVTSVDPVDLSFARCERCHELIHDTEFITSLLAKEDAEREQRLALRGVLGVVYYMRFGDRVKIGYTSDLRVRALEVPNDEVLAAEPGDYETERERHMQFKDLKVPAFKEWFRHEEVLMDHIAEVRERHGDPFALNAERVERRQQIGAA